MAATAGLPMVGDKKDPCKTTTYGVGELVRHAVEQGAKHIILGLGGSAPTTAAAAARRPWG